MSKREKKTQPEARPPVIIPDPPPSEPERDRMEMQTPEGVVTLTTDPNLPPSLSMGGVALGPPSPDSEMAQAVEAAINAPVAPDSPAREILEGATISEALADVHPVLAPDSPIPAVLPAPDRWMGWREVFAQARSPFKRSPPFVVRLSAEDFRKALSQLDYEMEGLSRGDPRYQEACRTGRLEWYDEAGACVVLERA